MSPEDRGDVVPPFCVKPLEMGSLLPEVNYECCAELQAMDDEELLARWGVPGVEI